MGCATAPPAPAPAAVRADLQAVKNAVVRAYIELDAPALNRAYTEDFTVTDAAGKVRTKADELAYVRARPKQRLIAGRYEIDAVRVYGKIAVASGHAEMQSEGPDGPRNITYRSFNVFRWEHGRWRYAAAFTP